MQSTKPPQPKSMKSQIDLNQRQSTCQEEIEKYIPPMFSDEQPVIQMITPIIVLTLRINYPMSLSEQEKKSLKFRNCKEFYQKTRIQKGKVAEESDSQPKKLAFNPTNPYAQ